MKYVAVCPYIWKPYKEEFEKTCKLDVMYVDNTERNLGIMRSHNLGIERMEEQGADWLIIMSAAIRFGDEGGLDFVRSLEDNMNFINIGAADKDQWDNHQQVGIFGWHLIAFSKECINKVGKWDENFFPYGYDDIDYSIRMQKAFPDPEYSRRTKKVPVDVHDTTMAHSVNFAGVRSDNDKLIEYIERKWGVCLHGEGKENRIGKYYNHPFNNEENPIAWWPDTPEGGRWM